MIRMNCATLFTTKEIVLNYKWNCLTLCSSMECQCMKVLIKFLYVQSNSEKGLNNLSLSRVFLTRSMILLGIN